MGALEYTWRLEPAEITAGTTSEVQIDIPGDAFLHELALDYVTDLRVLVYITETYTHRDWVEVMPEGFLAFADAGTSVTFLDRPAMRQDAPHGITNAEIRASYPGLGVNQRVIAYDPDLADASRIDPREYEDHEEGAGEW